MNKFENAFCPLCGRKLIYDVNRLVCENGHSYDISKEGYVNLLPPSKKGEVPGDNKDMVRARRNFLSLGHYSPLKEALIQTAASFGPGVLYDIGCGEGWYTSGLSAIAVNTYGFDISKFALQYAARADKKTSYITANLHNLPVAAASADVICCCFCAYDGNEFARVLAPGGRFILVSPGKRHLFGLKEFLYSNAYENDVSDDVIEGFALEGKKELSFFFTIEGQDNIMNLFAMTPYYWKTPKESTDRLRQLESLETEAEFIIRTYIKQ